jgi:predicted SnoaL-like aldol condensation-catalyzing enzyme
MTTSDALGAHARQVMIDIFRKKDVTAVDRNFSKSFIQHDPNLARNLSGHTQVDGPTAVDDREKTEANRTLMQTYRNIITIQQHYDRVDEFLADNYTQHAPGFGDGIERVKARYALDVKPGASHVLTPRFYVADGNFVLSVVDARTDPPKANYDIFRIANAKIAEHWEVLSPIPPRDQWKNSNGPFERHS